MWGFVWLRCPLCPAQPSEAVCLRCAAVTVLGRSGTAPAPFVPSHCRRLLVGDRLKLAPQTQHRVHLNLNAKQSNLRLLEHIGDTLTFKSSPIFNNILIPRSLSQHCPIYILCCVGGGEDPHRVPDWEEEAESPQGGGIHHQLHWWGVWET